GSSRVRSGRRSTAPRARTAPPAALRTAGQWSQAEGCLPRLGRYDSRPPHPAVRPAGGLPRGGVEAIASVDDDAPVRERGGVLGRELAAVFVPLGDEHDGIGLRQR